MPASSDRQLIDWLFTNGGPILRYRVATDLMDDTDPVHRQQLLQDVLACAEVQRWLENLAKSRNIHGSKDIDAENPLAKLAEYGLRAGIPALDQKVLTLFDRYLENWNPLTLTPFLMRLGYADHPLVTEWFTNRLEKLHRTALKGDFDFYLSTAEAANVPKAWRGKPIYKDEMGHEAGYPLPTCYDFYALAHWQKDDPRTRQMIEDIVAFLSDPRFQSTVGGYGWDRAKKRCYAAGRVFLACAEPNRLVLFLELGAKFSAARQSEWFRQGFARLEGFYTSWDTYRFPRDLLKENVNGYYLYGGSHMGLGENRRQPNALELESTFRILNIRKLMQTG